MTGRREWARSLWRAQPGLHRGYVVDLCTAVLMACALILGGRDRTVAAAWQTLNDNGGPLLWGAVFAVAGAALLAATFISPRAMMIALWLSATPYALIGWWFFHVAAFLDDSASFVGALLCLRAAIMHLSRATAYWEGRTGAVDA